MMVLIIFQKTNLLTWKCTYFEQ